ncbi:MAG: hypothetical protein WD049_09960 [Candidatus Paceibacterota bacterium]
MKQASATEGQQRLLTRFSEAGGVVEFVFLDYEDDASNERMHYAAVLAALKEIQRRADDYAERTSKEQGIPTSRFFQVNIDSEAAKTLTPRRITWTEFLGPRYDFDRDGLIVRGKGDFLNEFFFFRDRETRDNIIPSNRIDDGVGTGFAYAFSSPPYSIQLPAGELGELFDKFVQFIVFGSNESLIFEWPTDWSNYFDAGKEWWGTFLWSISNPGSSRIVVIAASTTD